MAQFYCRNVEMVAVGVRFASENLAHEKPFQASFDRLNLLKGIHFQAC